MSRELHGRMCSLHRKRSPQNALLRAERASIAYTATADWRPLRPELIMIGVSSHTHRLQQRSDPEYRQCRKLKPSFCRSVAVGFDCGRKKARHDGRKYSKTPRSHRHRHRIDRTKTYPDSAPRDDYVTPIVICAQSSSTMTNVRRRRSPL